MTIRAVAEYIIDKLLEQEFIIHRYDSCSTNSIYLKLDFGVMNSIRISDHIGKQHLSYRYNVELGVDKASWSIDDKGYWRYKCSNSKEDVDRLVAIIITSRNKKKIQYGVSYEDLVNTYKKQSSKDKGFWSGAIQIVRGK